MSLRILHVLDHSIPLQSGYAFRTLAILREQRALGWKTFHLTSPKHYGTEADEETIDGWHFYRTPMSKTVLDRVAAIRELKLMTAIARRIAEVARHVSPDIVHVHSPVLNVLPALRVAPRLGVPIVYEVRALWEDAAVDHGTTREGSLRYKGSRWLETFALRRVSGITTLCDGMRGEIISRGIAETKVTVIPNAVDISEFSSNPRVDEELQRSLGLVGETVLGFVGSFYAYEGLDLLLDAIPRLLPRTPRLKVLLVGGGPQESTLKRQVAALGLDKHVIFAGRVPHDRVRLYYDLIDVLVYPRRSMRLTELVTPLKPLEAMAQGRVLIASGVGGHKELVQDTVTGYLFPAGNVEALARRIDEVLSARADWPPIRNRARRFVESERTWDKSVARYVAVYDSVRNYAQTGRGIEV